MQAFATACAGFLLAVLWFDLMHDVLARGDGPSAEGLETIRRYYRRVTTDAKPMSLLVMLGMLGLVVALVAELLGDSVPAWAPLVSLPLAVGPILLARFHTVPTAVALGRGELGALESKAVLRDHVVCFACITSVLVVQLASLAT